MAVLGNLAVAMGRTPEMAVPLESIASSAMRMESLAKKITAFASNTDFANALKPSASLAEALRSIASSPVLKFARALEKQSLANQPPRGIGQICNRQTRLMRSMSMLGSLAHPSNLRLFGARARDRSAKSSSPTVAVELPLQGAHFDGSSADWAIVMGLIDHLARRLAGVFNLGRHDHEDLQQDMALDVTRALQRYDCTRSTWRAYLVGVLDKGYPHNFRTLANKRRGPFLEDADAIASDACGPDSDISPVAKIASEEVIATVHALPDDLKHLASQLMRATPREIANAEGVHRGTIYRRRKRLEKHFEDFDPHLG